MGQDEGKLPHLKQGQAREERRAGGETQQTHREGGPGGLDHEQEEQEERDDLDLVYKKLPIQQHPHRDEEKTGEQLAQRQNDARGLVAVIRFRDDQAGDEGSQRQRKSRLGREKSHRKPDGQREQQEELLAVRLRHGIEQGRQHEPRQQPRRQQNAGRLAQQCEDVTAQPLSFPGQHRHHQHHGHHDQILEDQNGERVACVRSMHLLAVVQGLEHHGRAGKGEDKSHKHRLRRRVAQQVISHRRHCHCPEDLHKSPHQNHATNPNQLLNRQLHTDDEEEQDDPDFREHLHFMLRSHQAQPVGPDDHPRHQKTDDRRQAQALEKENDKNGEDQDYQNVLQKRQMHGLMKFMGL